VTGSSPTAFITLGGAGSGKTTVSRRLSAATGAAYLDKDALAGPLVRFALEALGHDPTDRESNEAYVSQVMPLEYEALFAVAGENLALGHSVVLDAPFVAYLADPDFLAAAIGAARWPEADIRVVHVRASSEIVRERVRLRGLDRDRAKLADWPAYWDRFGTLTCAWRTGRHSVVRNDDDAQTLLDLEHLVAAAREA